MTTTALKTGAPKRVMMEGSKAITESAVRGGCRFYTGYPIQPSTHLLEYMARRLPEVGGVCINAESELEGVNMLWGASAAGARAMITSTGTGLSLMQEAFAELCNANLPCVIIHMSRGQSEYWQATKGGGHGDYHLIVLAPSTVQEAADLVYDAFEIADKWRHPVMVQGDYVLGHTVEAVALPEMRTSFPKKDWTVEGAKGRNARLVSFTNQQTPSGELIPYGQLIERSIAKYATIEQAEVRVETRYMEDAEVALVAFGYAARFCKHSVELAREQGLKVGLIRPISLWPFPKEAIIKAAGRVKAFAVFELNSGQMVDDVRLAVLGTAPIEFIGKISQDPSGFGVGPALNSELILNDVKKVYQKYVR